MTKYITKEEMNDEAILEVAQALKCGRLVVFPTDTVYGIGTNAFLENACKKVYEVKGRPESKPLLVLISDLFLLYDLVEEVNSVEQKLIDMFWPGPLTIKFRKKVGVFPDIVSAGDAFVRVRLVGEGVIQKLIHESGVPVVAPSANLSGNLTGTKIENVIREFDGKVDYILDYGDIESDVTSTIVEVVNHEISILRKGKITESELLKVASLKEE